MKTLDARMSDLVKAQARLRLRSETDRIARNLEQARNGIPASAGQASEDLSIEVSKLVEELSAVEGELDRRQGETARTLSGIEGRLEETKGIFNDALDNTGGNPDEALPILRIISENLDRVDNELSAVAQLVKAGEQEGSIMATTLGKKVSGILDQVAQSRLAREKNKASPPKSDVALSSGSRGITDAVKAIDEGGSGSRFKPSILSEGADIGSARQTATGQRSSASSLEELRAKLASSYNLQVALSEDTEKLQSDLRRAYREIVSLQTSVKESERLVNELEESRMALLKTRGQNASGVEAVSRMVSRLEAELKTSREELKAGSSVPSFGARSIQHNDPNPLQRTGENAQGIGFHSGRGHVFGSGCVPFACTWAGIGENQDGPAGSQVSASRWEPGAIRGITQ